MEIEGPDLNGVYHFNDTLVSLLVKCYFLIEKNMY